MKIAVILVTIFIVTDLIYSIEFNDYDINYGVYLGELSNLANGDVKGKVYAINETAIQLVNFTYNGNGPDVYFWLDRTEIPTKEGVKVASPEFGVAPLGKYENAQIVLVLPGLHKITSFKVFALYCLNYNHNYGHIEIREDLNVPKPQFLHSELHGSRYRVGSGPILILDRRTIKIFGFTFDGDKAPDGYFFVGRGPKVVYDAGVKVPIRGKDTPDVITSMNEKYRGGQDIIIDLPEDYDINHIDWLAVFCYKFRVNFGHVLISNVSLRIPPYVPPMSPFDNLKNIDGWQIHTLLGTPKRLSFTFQLGSPGNKKGYQYMTRTKPGNYIWYVNGLMADLYLKRNVTYTFIVQGGNDKSTNDFYNPLYLSNDQNGGYSKLSNDEKENIKIYAGATPSNDENYVGGLCLWTPKDSSDDCDSYNSFDEFKNTLNLKCDDSSPSKFTFTPSTTTPDVIYFQSFNNYYMGNKIHIVDDLPDDLEDFVEEPYQYEAWLKHHNLELTPRGANSCDRTVLSVIIMGFILFIFY